MTADQLKDLSKRIIGIREFLKIDEKKLQLKEHELKTHDPEFWNDPKSAEAHMKLIRELILLFFLSVLFHLLTEA